MINGINAAAMFDRLFTRAMPVSGLLVKLLATPLSIGLIVLTPMIVSESTVQTSIGFLTNARAVTDNVNTVPVVNTNLVLPKASCRWEVSTLNPRPT